MARLVRSSPPRYAVFSCERAAIRAQAEYSIPLLVLQAPVWLSISIQPEMAIARPAPLRIYNLTS